MEKVKQKNARFNSYSIENKIWFLDETDKFV